MERHTTLEVWGLSSGVHVIRGHRLIPPFLVKINEIISLLEFKVQRCNKILCILFYLHVGMS